MPGAADLELSLRATAGDEYAAELRFLPPGGAAEAHLVGPPPPRVRLDPEALHTVGVAADPAAYGARLTGMLFADPRLREGLGRTQALATGAPLHREYELTGFLRQFQLPEESDPGRIAAQLTQGVLTLRQPRAAPAAPHRGPHRVTAASA